MTNIIIYRKRKTGAITSAKTVHKISPNIFGKLLLHLIYYKITTHKLAIYCQFAPNTFCAIYGFPYFPNEVRPCFDFVKNHNGKLVYGEVTNPK